MSTDGEDPKDKRPTPPSTLAGVVPQPPRPGLPPPRSTHGGPPPPRSGSQSGQSPYAPRPGSQSNPPFVPGGQPAPFSQPQQPSPFPQAQPQQPQPQPQPQPQAQPQQQPQPQPPAQPQPQPQPQPPQPQPSQPWHQQPPQQSPFAATPPILKDPEWAQGFPNQPQGQQPLPTAIARPREGVPEAQLLQSESSPIEQLADAVQEVPGRFVGFLKISAKRAFRLRIEPSEVLPDERQMLAAANPPIVDENLQAFLAWRRSVLFLVATILTLLSIIGLIDAFSGTRVATAVRWVKLLPTLAEVAFCAICWLSLRHWTNWRKQSRWLLFGWLLFMLAPFVVFMYPLKSAVMEAGRAMTLEQMRELGWHGVYNKAVAPFAFAMLSMLALAPKVISLMPGLIRSAMVIKLLFPGAAAPGWLIVMAAPMYAMIAYAVLVIPYQFTAEPWFMFGVVLIVIAQVLVTRSGFALAKPLTQEETLKHIKRVRMFYTVLLVTALISIIGGLGLLVKLLGMKWTTVITTVLKFEANVMILTTIGADLVMTNLDRARGYTEGKEQIEEETELKIAAFVGLNAPQTPPPPGPVQH